MRKALTLLLLLLVASYLPAQKSKNPDLPAFGKIDKSDLEMKECSFDEKAEALVLLDDAQMDFIWGSGMEMKRRKRIKILNEDGRKWADIHLAFMTYQNQQDISNLEAQTYNLDEKGNIVVTKLEKKLVYEKKLNKRFAEKTFTFPEVKVGSIIEYKYKKTGIGLSDWYFQSEIPVKYSRYTLDFPQEIEVAVIPFCSRNYNREEHQSGVRRAQTYSMSEIPGFRPEPYIINEDFYLDRLEAKVVDNRIAVRYLRFKQGSKEKLPT